MGYAISLVGLQYYVKYKQEDTEKANPTTGSALTMPTAAKVRRATRSVAVSGTSSSKGSRTDSKDDHRYKFGRSRSAAGLAMSVVGEEESREQLLDGGRGEEEQV